MVHLAKFSMDHALPRKEKRHQIFKFKDLEYKLIIQLKNLPECAQKQG